MTIDRDIEDCVSVAGVKATVEVVLSLWPTAESVKRQEVTQGYFRLACLLQSGLPVSIPN